jgi:hypothetical protein
VSTGDRQGVAPSTAVLCSPPAALPVLRGPRRAVALLSCLSAPPGRHCAGHCSGSNRSAPPASPAAGSHEGPLWDARCGWAALAPLAGRDRSVLTARPADCSSRLLLCPVCSSERSSPPGTRLCSPLRRASLPGPCACPRAPPAAAGSMAHELPSCHGNSDFVRHLCQGHLCAVPHFACMCV